MTRRTAVAVAITSAAALGVAAPVVGQTAGSGHHPITINDAGYIPPTVVAAPGQHVVWTNVGREPHTATAENGAFDSGIVPPRGRFALMAPATPGAYPYFCVIHPYMRGTLQVQPGAPLPRPAARILGISAANTVPAGGRLRIVARFSAAPLGAVVLQRKVGPRFAIVARARVKNGRAVLVYRPSRATKGRQVLRVRFRVSEGLRYSRLISVRVRPANR